MAGAILADELQNSIT